MWSERSCCSRSTPRSWPAHGRLWAHLVSDSDLARPYPDPPKGLQVTTRDYLIHLISHFTYHLGQLDYHRRLLTGQPGQIRAVAPGDVLTGEGV